MTVTGSDGRTLVIVGEDWTPPASTDPQAHVDYLQKMYDHTKDALDKAKKLDDAARKRVEQAARKALDTGKDLAKDVEQGAKLLKPPALTLAEHAGELKDKMAETAKTIAPLYFGIGIATWLIVGGVAWFIYTQQKESGREAGERMKAAGVAA